MSSAAAARGRPQRRPYAARVAPALRREQLLDAAITVIVRDGYDRVSIETVAREAGVTRPVVYGVFAGLDELLGALLDRQEQRAMAQLESVLDLDDLGSDPVAAATAVVRGLVATVQGDPVTWSPILLPSAGTPGPVQRRIERDKARVREQLALLIAALLGAEEAGGPDAEVLSHALLAVLEHFGRVLLTEPDRFDADRLAAVAAGFVGTLVGRATTR